MKLSGKTAVVTGASKGIGAGIAKALAAAGATVIVNYASSQRDAEKVVSHIRDAGGKAYGHPSGYESVCGYYADV